MYPWDLDCEESWAPKNWCFWTVVLERTLESPLDCKEIQPVHPKGDQSWVFIGRNDAEAETPILGPPHAKSWLIGKDPDAGRDWGQEEKGTTEDEMAGWHHQLEGHEFEWTPGVGDGQGGLACCNSWGREESDMTERLNWTELKGLLEQEALKTHFKRWLIIITNIKQQTGINQFLVYCYSHTVTSIVQYVHCLLATTKSLCSPPLSRHVKRKQFYEWTLGLCSQKSDNSKWVNGYITEKWQQSITKKGKHFLSE